MQPPAFKFRPRSGLPVPFWLFGLFGLAAVPTAAAVDPAALLGAPPGPSGMLVLHLVTLGFLGPVMMGAYYQLVPVVLHAEVPAAAWGHVVGVCFGAGTVAFLVGWGVRDPVWIAAGGALAGAALLGFVIQMAAAMRRLRGSSPPALALSLGLIALVAVAILGPLLALRLAGVAVPSDPVAHMAAGLGGWLLLTIMGATYQLVPFFAATAPPVRAPAAYAAVALVAAGVLMLALGLGRPALGGWIGLVGMLLWAWDLVQLAGHGRQARREPVVSFSMVAVLLLVAGAAGAEVDLLGASIPPRAVFLLGALAGPAVLITAQLQKILPFVAALDAALDAKRRGQAPRTEALFPRGSAFALLVPLSTGLVAMAVAAGLGSPAGVRAAAVLSALSSYAYVGKQMRVAAVWWRARAGLRHL